MSTSRGFSTSGLIGKTGPRGPTGPAGPTIWQYTGDISGADIFYLTGNVLTNDLSSNTIKTNDLSSNTIQTNDLSAITIQTNDLSANTIQTDTIGPILNDAYGINYKTDTEPLRTRHIFGEDIMMGKVPPQSYTFTSNPYGSFFIRVSPSDLLVNTFNDVSMLVINDLSGVQYLALDISNNKAQYHNSVIEFNASLDISSNNLDKVEQTVFFLHPGPVLSLPNSYYPNPSNGDIIIDTRTTTAAANSDRKTIVYGTRRLFVNGEIPSSISDLSGSIYVPHLACALQNSGPKINLNGGNISMNQRVLS